MVVVFDIDKFLEAFPHLAQQVTAGKVTHQQLRYAFQLAELFIDNTDGSPIPFSPEQGVWVRETLLFLLVCHIVSLALWPVGVAGPMTNASEGSVSAGFQSPVGRGGEWFKMTPCGQTLWVALRPYAIGGRYYTVRTFHPWG